MIVIFRKKTLKTVPAMMSPCNFMRALACITSLLISGGCASISGNGEYYRNQPKIATAQREQTAAVMAGLSNLAGQLFQPPPVPVQPIYNKEEHAPQHVAAKKKMPVSGPHRDDVFTVYDTDGTAWSRNIELSSTSDDDCTAEHPCLEGVASGPQVSKQQVPVVQQPSPQGGGAAEALLQVLLAQERTKQVAAFMVMGEKVLLRPQHKQAAPFDPSKVLTGVVNNAPLISSIIGGAVSSVKIAEAGIVAAHGDVTAQLNDGSSLATEAAGATGSAPTTTIKTVLPEEEK